MPLPEGGSPEEWEPSLRADVELTSGGTYGLWLAGVIRGTVVATVDGERIGEVRDQLNNFGEYTRLGEIELRPARTRSSSSIPGRAWHPAVAGASSTWGR